MNKDTREVNNAVMQPEVVESFGFEESSGVVVYTSFDDMKVPRDLLRGIFSYGWEHPSPIQQKAIMPLIEGHDIIAQAQSGTGKTGAFTIGSVGGIKPEIQKPQVLMLSPVRDLAVQTYHLVKNLIQYTNVKATLLIGMGTHDGNAPGGNGGPRFSMKMNQQEKGPMEEIDWNAQIIVGTPGRILDVLRKERLASDSFQKLIVDEADEMLSKGFKEQIRSIFQYMPPTIQVGLFSATMPEDILELTAKFMREPLRILVKKEMLTLEGIRQYFVKLNKESEKQAVIMDLYESISLSQTMIFCNSKQRVMEMRKMLEENNHSVEIIHGGLTQLERNKIMDNFRMGKTRILISTDMLSRGIDIQQVSLIINYDLPYKPEQYLHRIGRSGRYGRKGIAINLVTDEDYKNLRLIEKFYNTQIDEMPMNFMNYLS